MTFMIIIDDRHVAVSNNDSLGVYQQTPQERKMYLAELETGRIKYTPVLGKQVFRKLDVMGIWFGHWHKSVDQVSPFGEREYDDGDGYSVARRWEYVCPVTGQTWICEKSTKLGSY